MLNNSKISGDFNVNKKVDIWQAGCRPGLYPEFLTTSQWHWHGGKDLETWMATTRAASSPPHPIIFPNIFFPSRQLWGYLTPSTRMMTEREVSEKLGVRTDKFRGNTDNQHYPGQKTMWAHVMDSERTREHMGANQMSGNGVVGVQS